MFKRLGRLGLAALTLATAPLLADDDAPQARERWHQAIDQRYGVLVDASERLEASADRFCEQPDTSHRRRLTQDWLEAYQAWQAVRFVDFGPIEQQSRAWQLQFWPDRKNLVGRKMQAWLAADQPPSAEQIADGSVAAQGFPALEYLLFDDAMQDDEALTTRRLRPDAGHRQPPGGWHQRPTPRLATFRRPLSAHRQLYRRHPARRLLALETLEDKRLGSPMGLTGGAPNGYLAEAWRSGRSIRLIEAPCTGWKIPSSRA